MSGSEKEKVSGSSRGGGMVGKPGAVARDDSDHGSVKKHMSKKELEELRKKQEEVEAAAVLKDFVASFDDSKKVVPKMFVKASVINPSTKEEKVAPDKGELYAPALKLASKLNSSLTDTSATTKSPLIARTKEQISDAAAVAALNEQERAVKKKMEENKKKSNLELFKEELKRIQLEREERQRKKPDSTGVDGKPLLAKPESSKSDMDLSLEMESSGDSNGPNVSHTGNKISVEDPNSTNIFISNLSPKTCEKDLIDRFGKYGLLASVKIMWPRTDEDKTRNANCGFVAFMNRRDAEEALRNLDAVMIHGHTMRLSWSKSITIPSQPVYIPPELADVIVPPPPSGLPFNAQPLDSKKLRAFRQKYHLASSNDSSGTSSSDRSRSSSRSSSSSSRSNTRLNSKSDVDKILKSAVVKVVIPSDRSLLSLINKVVEYVVNEGPAFEAMLMTREINNPQYRFLFDNQAPAHGYYRWRLYSILNGDSSFKWRTKPFRMFENGSYWIPPPLIKYTQGSPDEAYDKALGELETQKEGALSREKKERFEELIKNLNTERKSISEAMIFCIDNADKANDMIESIKQLLKSSETSLNKKIALLYLITDILHNCIVKVANASTYRKGFETNLETMFQYLNETWSSIDGKMKSESFKQKVLNCIRAWEDRAIYPNDFLVKLQNMFLGLLKKKPESKSNGDDDDDVDGKPLDDDDDEELDGKPLDDESEKKKQIAAAKFVSSKWETVDPDELEKQVITTSKWDFFDENQDKKNDSDDKSNMDEVSGDDDESDEDIDGKPMDDDDEPESEQVNKIPAARNLSELNLSGLVKRESDIDESKRKILREIEVKVLSFVDDLENGVIKRKGGKSIQEQAEEYRAELLSRIEEEKSRARASPSRSRSPDSPDERGKRKKRSRSVSPRRAAKTAPSAVTSSTSSDRRRYK